MSPTRRQVVNAIAAGALVPGTVATAEAQDGDDQDFSPDITISPNNLVATIGERDDDVDPDTVTIYTSNGDEHEFDGAAPNDWEAGDAFEVGYTHDESRARLEGWHGVIDGVTATKDGETVSATNDDESTLEVTCSLWKTPDQPPTQFEVLSEGARKQHHNRGDDDLSEDQRQYGSPGRALQTVAERHPEIAMRVDFDGCTPETQKALRFDCTSVTVEPEELNQGEERIHDVQLRFADGTHESPPGTANEEDDGAYDVPVTLSGSGENEGKVIERLEFKVPSGEYTYWNLEAEQCATQQDASSDDSGDGDGDGSGNGDGSGEDNTGDDGAGGDDGGDASDGSDANDGGDGSSDESGDGSQNQGPGADSNSDDGSGSSGGTETDDGSASSGDSSGSQGGDSGGGSSDDDSGALLDTDSDDATETPTPDDSNTENVTVNGTDGTAGANDTGTANGSGASGNGSTGGENGSSNGSSEPGIATGTPAEDQPGLGFAAGLGGLLGFGELARRKLGVEKDE